MLNSICWNITHRCNDACAFCNKGSASELSLADNKVIMSKLIDYGFEKISIVGGEPLLYEDIFELISFGKLYKNDRPSFSITTNAKLIFDEENRLRCDYLDSLIDLFDWITLPIDHVTDSSQHEVGRDIHHLHRVRTIMDYVAYKKSKVNIKVNTMLNAKNIDSIGNLVDFMLKYDVIKRWKLFKFLPSRGAAIDNQQKYNITQQQFSSACEIIMNSVRESKRSNSLVMTFDDFITLVESYVIATPDGFLTVCNGSEYSNVLNLVEEDIGRINDFIDVDTHLSKRLDYKTIKLT